MICAYANFFGFYSKLYTKCLLTALLIIFVLLSRPTIIIHVNQNFNT